jgi:uncharacterized membrane protein
MLRGAVMLLMVLDHARFFMHDFAGHPEDLSKTYPLLFFTRWITHFCAPVFIFLVGVSAHLYSAKHGLRQTASYLVKRGALLVLLELTIFRLAWDGSLTNSTISLLVIWAIGISMMFLAFIIRIQKWALLLSFALLVICFHHLLDNVPYDGNTVLGKLWMILHVPGTFPLTTTTSIFILYPVLPYFGIVTAGWCLGRYYVEGPQTFRRRLLLWSGLVCTGAFLLLRFLNAYGDPNPWATQPEPAFSLLSFLKTTKYPTSLLFVLMTLGPALLFLFATDKARPGWFGNVLIVIGRVPLFFYLLHLFVVRFIAFLMGKGHHNYSLAQVYIGWLISCTLLYALCKWYGAFKSSHRSIRWLSYI